MDKVYDPQAIEKKWIEYWEGEQLYSPTLLKDDRPSYSILLPPPNANASLHAGHAMFVVQDILIRYYRMKGYNAVWIPGTDHAGFETQYVFEKQLAKQGSSRFEYNRNDLYDAVATFVEENSGLIEEQLKSLGFSLDWSRKTFTLDARVIKTVYQTFEKMYKDELIYRDNYIVNYCTHCGTTFSELEIVYSDRVDSLYYIKYIDGVTVATVRPETLFGDVALAVHPDDPKYSHLHEGSMQTPSFWQLIKDSSKIAELGLSEEDFQVKIIKDEYVDPAFGTGALKVTPAHDPNDFALARKHGLKVRQLIEVDGRLNSLAGPFAGMKVKAAREAVVKALEEQGLIEKIDSGYGHRVSGCYKCGREIEPLVLPNWFIRMKPLALRAKEAVVQGHVKFYPTRFEDEFYRWMDSIKDWPISRQIVWGIRIPAWYDVAKNPKLYVTFLNSEGSPISGYVNDLMHGVNTHNHKRYTVSEITAGLQQLTAPSEATFVIADDCPDKELFLPETDTFDTWFSSGQWPLVTLGYPDGEDFKKLYPTSVMDTMWDILFFWVARMIMLGIYVNEKDGKTLEDSVPFKQVLLHSRVVDAKGQKMSKSKGNVVNPLDMTAKFGTDAFRMSLIAGSALGNDVPMAEDKVKGYRNFANKVWNSARFVIEFKPEDLQGLEDFDAAKRFRAFENLQIDELALRYQEQTGDLRALPENELIVSGLYDVMVSVRDSIERYRFSDAAVAIYEFYWHEFCDKYIEFAKDKREETQATLEFVLKTSMELLHPFMPFITEEIWQKLPHEGKSISV